MTRPIATLSLVMFAAHFAIPPAAAQYPTKPIHLIVPAAPGGGTDIAARSFVPALQDDLGQPVVIENRGGAGGIIGTDLVAKAAPDGYTLLLCYVSHATNPTLVAKLPYDTLRDFAPITLVAHEPTLLVTHPSVPVNTLAEFIAYARERPGKLSYGTDPGSAGFLAGELFKQTTGLTSIEYVAYKGSGPAAADVVAGHLPYMWSVISIVTPFIKAGRLKGLAIAAERRAPNLPEVPTTGEAAQERDRPRARRGGESAAERGSTSAPRDVGVARHRRRPGAARRAHPARDRALGEGAQSRGRRAQIGPWMA